jgi:DNA-binding NarL/FixJ family response regulator
MAVSRIAHDVLSAATLPAAAGAAAQSDPPVLSAQSPAIASLEERLDGKARLVIVDSHPLFRVGLRQSLASLHDFDVVGEAATAREAFSIVDALHPHIVLTEIALPGIDGVIATREIVRRAPQTKVVILSVSDRGGDVWDAFDAGAVGYALKTDGPDNLASGLRSVMRGERYVAPALAPRMAAFNAQPTEDRDPLSVLSVREREVFRLAADCLLTREIARELCIARKTVDTHLHRIHRKLGLRSSAELVRLAANLGLGLSTAQRTATLEPFSVAQAGARSGRLP